jgi:hypothetical protein
VPAQPAKKKREHKQHVALGVPYDNKVKLTDSLVELLTVFASDAAMAESIQLAGFDVGKIVSANLTQRDVEDHLLLLDEAKQLIKEKQHVSLLHCAFSFFTTFPPADELDSAALINVFVHQLARLRWGLCSISTLLTVNAAHATAEPTKQLVAEIDMGMRDLGMNEHDSAQILKYITNSNYAKSQFKMLDIWQLKADKLDYHARVCLNRKLLWLGLRFSEVYTVLSSLRFAPGEMGMYWFCDTFSEALRQAESMEGKKTCLLLCDVALGTEQQVALGGQPAGEYDSIVRKGASPPENGDVDHDGLKIARGKNRFADFADGYTVPQGKLQCAAHIRGTCYGVPSLNQFKPRFLVFLGLFQISIFSRFQTSRSTILKARFRFNRCRSVSHSLNR